MDNIVVKNKSKEYCLNVIKPFFEANGYSNSMLDENADKGGYFAVVDGMFWWGVHIPQRFLGEAQLIELPELEFPKEMLVWNEIGQKRNKRTVVYISDDKHIIIDSDADQWDFAEDIKPEKKSITLSEILKEYASEKYPDCDVIDDLKRKDVRMK